MKVINIFGGPGVGKSTVAAELFAEMKKKGYNVELVTEYAKDMVWEGRDNILADQLYILAKQNRRLSRLDGKVDYAITDSPLLFGIIYSKNITNSFKKLVESIWYSYDNISFFLNRDFTRKYHPEGRVQKTLPEAVDFDNKIYSLLNDYDEYNVQVTVDDNTINTILKYMKDVEEEEED
jgi:hypothetical protein